MALGADMEGAFLADDGEHQGRFRPLAVERLHRFFRFQQGIAVAEIAEAFAVGLFGNADGEIGTVEGPGQEGTEVIPARRFLDVAEGHEEWTQAGFFPQIIEDARQPHERMCHEGLFPGLREIRFRRQHQAVLRIIAGRRQLSVIGGRIGAGDTVPEGRLSRILQRLRRPSGPIGAAGPADRVFDGVIHALERGQGQFRVAQKPQRDPAGHPFGIGIIGAFTQFVLAGDVEGFGDMAFLQGLAGQEGAFRPP